MTGSRKSTTADRRTLLGWLSDNVRRYLATELSTNPPIASCLGFLVPLGPVGGPPPRADEHGPEDRVDHVLAWVRSGDLTWSEAEALLELDESTPWS